MPGGPQVSIVTAPESTDRGDRRAARALLDRAAEAQVRAAAIAEIAERARLDVIDAYEAAHEQQVWATTAKMSIEAIKDVTDGRLKLNSLPNHGYFTVADVLRAGPDRLVDVPGIGEGTAAKVVGAAEQIQQAVRDSLQFRIDLEPNNALTTRLLQAVAVWGSVRHASETHGPQASQLAKDLAALRPAAAPAAAGRLRRLFLRGRRKASATAAVERIASMLSEAETSGLLRAAHDVGEVRVPGPAAVWRDFERQSTQYYGLLGQLVDLGRDVAAAEGYLPADIVERVNEQRLDDFTIEGEPTVAGLPVLRCQVRARAAARDSRR